MGLKFESKLDHITSVAIDYELTSIVILPSAYRFKKDNSSITGESRMCTKYCVTA